MKKTLHRTTLLMGILVLCAWTYAQKEYTIKQFTGNYTIDAVADELFWAGADEITIASADLSDGNTPPCMEADSDDDISAKFKYVYNATVLLVYAEVLDNEVMFQDITYACGGSWSVDGLELYFITTNDATSGQAVGDNNTVGGMHLRIQMNEDGTPSYPTDGGITSVEYLETSDGYNFEIAIDLSAFLSYRVPEPVVIVPGTTQIGFDATVNDSDVPDEASCEQCRIALIAWNSRNNALYGDASQAGKMNFSDEVIGAIALDTHDQSSIKIYPNPAEKMIFIESELLLSNIQILNLAGSEVLNVKDYSKGIDVSSLQTGVYILKADSYVSKFTIK